VAHYFETGREIRLHIPIFDIEDDQEAKSIQRDKHKSLIKK
jgi:hypothetical protein